MEPRISFITLGVRDLPLATRFYTEVLQLALLPSSTLEVSRSGYYAWRSRPPSTRFFHDRELTERINPLFDQQRNDVAADEASSSDGEHLHLSPDGDG